MTEEKMFRFFRPPPPFSKLARIVWHPKVNRAIAEFGKNTNQFFTSDEWVAAELLKLGYRQIALDLKHPPFMAEPEIPEVGDIHINPNLTEESAAAASKRKAMMANADWEDDGTLAGSGGSNINTEELPPTPEKKAPEKKAAAKSKKAAKTSPETGKGKRTLKRRAKK